MTNKLTALKAVLVQAKVCNENGDQMVDFTSQNRDCLDFASLNRASLLKMLETAYEYGRTHEAGKVQR